MMKYLQMNLWIQSLYLLCFLLMMNKVNAQVSLTSTTYSQDFNTLANTSTSDVLPTGWLLLESGTNANTTYATDNGGSNAGNTYSYGTTSESERAFGSLQSGSLIPLIGVAFTNNTGATINSITINYTGEMWRLGAADANDDRLDFQYSLNATTLNTGTWTDVNELDFVSLTQTGVGAKNGNDAAFRSAKNFTITGLNIANGATFFLRWVDFNVSSSDDGLAVDDFEMTVAGGPDITPPTFTSTYPKAGNIAQTSFDVLSNLNESGKTYFVIVADGTNSTITTAQVKAGQDAAGTALANNFKGTITNTNANTEYSGTASGLTASTNYDVYVVAEDNIPNIQSTVTKIDVMTASASAPTLMVNGTLTDFGTVNFNATSTSQNYTISGTNLTNDVTIDAPDNFQVSKDNTNFSDVITFTAAEVNANNQTIHVRFAPTSGTNGVKSGNITHTTTGVTTQNQAVSGTEAGNIIFTENFNTCNNNVSSFSQFSVTGAQVWKCSTFGNNSSNGIDMNGFSGGLAQDNQDWLISPLLELSNNAVLTFFSKKDFNGADIIVRISTNYSGSGNPTSATWVDLTATLSSNPTGTSAGPWTSSGNISLSAYNNHNVYVAFFYQSSAALNAARWTIDDFSVTNATVRTLNVSNSTLSFGFVTAPNASTPKSYTVQGNNLTTNLVITAPTNFEVSKMEGSGYANSINFTAAEVSTPQTVYARFKPSAGSGTSTGNITHVSGSLSKNVAVSGTEGTNPADNQLDVVTFNVEWFGDNTKTPDDATQIANVVTLIQATDADIYCLQEITNINGNNDLQTVVNQLGASNWGFVRVTHNSTNGTPPAQQQARAFIYKKNIFSNISTPELIAPTDGWADGRYPVLFTADVTINGVTKKIRFINIHAKAGSTQDDFNRRTTASGVLKTLLDGSYATDNLIILGDHNDDLDVSIYNNQPSPYKNFVDDNTNYTDLTKTALSDQNISTTFGFSDAVDHIIVSNELSNAYVANSAKRIEVNSIVNNAEANLSDHFPVMASFNLANISPILNTSLSTLADFGSLENGATSTSKNYTMSGSNLTADVVVTAPANFKVSKDNTTFSNSITFTAAEVNAGAKTVHVQFAPTSGTAGVKTGNITHTSTGATSKNVAVTVTETAVTALADDLNKTLDIFPNPAQGYLKVSILNHIALQKAKIEMYNTVGQPITESKWHREADRMVAEFNTQNLPKGIYFVKISDEISFHIFRKIIIQ